MQNHKLIGHKHILDYLTQCLEHGALAHAHAFIGPNRIGRRTLLNQLLKKLIPGYMTQHPDISVIEPEPEKDIISIAQIRSGRAWLNLSPIASDRKALVIERAESMNTDAQNAFLKILEEPNQHTYVFLLINHRKQVLDTIYSRAVPVYFNPVPHEVMCKAGFSSDEAAASHGRPGILLAAKHSNTQDAGLFDTMASAATDSERMQALLRAGIDKKDVHQWLLETLPQFRKHLIKTKNPAFAKALQNTLRSLANSSGQNWQLVAEQTILSL